jgi:hypothetical protein
MSSFPVYCPVSVSASSLSARRWTGLALAIVVAIVAMAVAASSASAYIYVAGPLGGPAPRPSTIERLSLDGSFVQPNFIDGPRVEGGLEVHGDRLYWLDASDGTCRAASASLDGTDVRYLATVDSNGCGGDSIALTRDYLYWSGGGPISRMSIQPPYSVERDYIPRQVGDETLGLITNGTWLYWIDEIRHAVGRARVDGTQVEPALFDPEPHPGDAGLLGITQGRLWWANRRDWGSVGHSQLDGSDIERGYLTGIQVYGHELTSEWLYYTGSPCDVPGCVDVDGAIRRIALERGATPEFIAQRPAGTGYGIAVDSRDVGFSLRRIWKHRDGTATAVVPTRRPAEVSVHGRRIVPTKAKGLHSKVARVDIRPRRKARRALRRHRAVRVRVKIRVRTAGGSPWLHSRKLTLRVGRRR